jgi:c-di-GMP-binding flagellar brake protein YcgR
MEEKRRFVRLDTPIQVKYRISSKSNIQNNSVGKDISVGGVRMLIGEKMIPGTQIDLEINIPDYDKIIYATGEIVWQDETLMKNEVTHETGLKFVKIASEDREKIGKYIYKELNVRFRNPEEEI